MDGQFVINLSSISELSELPQLLRSDIQCLYKIPHQNWWEVLMKSGGTVTFLGGTSWVQVTLGGDTLNPLTLTDHIR